MVLTELESVENLSPQRQDILSEKKCIAEAPLPRHVAASAPGMVECPDSPIPPPDRILIATEDVTRSIEADVRSSSKRSTNVLVDDRYTAALIEKKESKKVVPKKGRVKHKEFLFADVRNSALSDRSRLQIVTDSIYYEWFSGSLIVVNALFLGWQTQHMAERAQDSALQNLPRSLEEPAGFVVGGVLFTILFTIELSLRWVADGFLHFFQTKELSWNLLDVTVVFFSILDTLIEVVGASDGGVVAYFSLLRVLRIVRIVRIAKVIRVMQFFRELRMMVFSILGCLKSLLWVVLVLCVMFYVFGICFTAATLTHLDTSDKVTKANETGDLHKSFGTLDRSMLSLYMAMSGGNDWAMYYDALMPLAFQYRMIFLFFISFALFAVVNIVTGVFVEAAMQANTNDREVVVHEEMQAKKLYLDSMRAIFEEMDNDNSGCVSGKEFSERLNDERVIAYFNSLKLDISDALTVFKLLDSDHSGEVEIDEFLEGCYRLQGDSRSLDMKIMQYQVKFLSDSFDGLYQHIIKLQETLSEQTAAIRQKPQLR